MRTARLRAQLDDRFGLKNIVGRDYKMLRLFDLVESVADTRTTVLILGESGTGKTVTARAIHQLSSRRGKPFVEVACGALPDSLLESELFGHVAGAFTGATHDKVGKFLQADGGTIFLDEVATASPSLQVKLLRVLQDREFEPVGGNKTQKVDVRLILATNRDLEQMVREGEFREDLFYRINVITVTQPPLRERIGDILLLIDHYLAHFNEQTGKKIEGFNEEALSAPAAVLLAGQRPRSGQRDRAVRRLEQGARHHAGRVARRHPSRRSRADRFVRVRPGSEPQVGPGAAGAADHPRRPGGSRLEPSGNGQGPRHQPHDAVQEDEEVRDRVRAADGLVPACSIRRAGRRRDGRLRGLVRHPIQLFLPRNVLLRQGAHQSGRNGREVGRRRVWPYCTRTGRSRTSAVLSRLRDSW